MTKQKRATETCFPGCPVPNGCIANCNLLPQVMFSETDVVKSSSIFWKDTGIQKILKFIGLGVSTRCLPVCVVRGLIQLKAIAHSSFCLIKKETFLEMITFENDTQKTWDSFFLFIFFFVVVSFDFLVFLL